MILSALTMTLGQVLILAFYLCFVPGLIRDRFSKGPTL